MLQTATTQGVLQVIPKDKEALLSREQAIGEARAYGWLERALTCRIEELQAQLDETDKPLEDEIPTTNYPAG
jgi:hypothetical protein